MESLKCQGLWLLVLLILATSEQVKADHPSTLDKQPTCFGISRGKNFILGFTDHALDSSFKYLSIVVVAFSDQQTNVTISSKHHVEGQPLYERFDLEAGGYRTTNVSIELLMDGTERSFKGIEVTATSEVSVYGFFAFSGFTTDGFLGIPVSNLGLQYIVASLYYTSSFAVIGTEDSTSVQVTLRGTVTFEGQSYSPGDQLNFMVDRLEAIHLEGSEDFTGSVIQANKPIATFTSSGWYTVIEQSVPVKSWGQNHIYTAFQSTDQNFYQIIAYFSGTSVTIPNIGNLNLNTGEFWEGWLSGSGLVSSSQPTLMMQMLVSINNSGVWESLIQVPAIEQFGYVFGFATPPNAGADSGGYFNFINIVVKTNAQETVHLNGSPINGSQVPVHENKVPNTTYTALSVQLPKGEGVYFVEQTDPLSSPLSVIVYGYDSVYYSESYGYAAGLSLPSNRQILHFSTYYLRELGGETFRITLPCLQDEVQSYKTSKCKFLTGIGNILISGHSVDSDTIVCITPTFYMNGFTSVYVSLDEGETFPYSGVVYITSEEYLPPLITVNQTQTSTGNGVIDLTKDDDLLLTWNPYSVGEGIETVNIIMQDSDYNGDGHPVLLEGVSLKNNVLNNGKIQISIELINDKSLTTTWPSLVAFYLQPNGQQSSPNRFYSGVNRVTKFMTKSCSFFLKRLKNIPTGLPPCPCTFAQASVDSLNFVLSNEFISFYHPGAKDCFRSTTSSSIGSGQQCCYAKDGNILIGPPGGGTADRYSPEDHFWKHQWYDVLPWFGCCKSTQNCKTYYKYRPSDDCSKYVPPWPAAGTGDPHITSLDGKRFTFNGAGEFLMSSSILHDLIFQSRMEVYHQTNASVYTAFVVQMNDSSTVQVQVSNSSEVLVLVDGEQLLMRSSLVKVYHFRGFRLSFTSDFSEIRIAFNAGIAIIVYIKHDFMSFTAQLNEKFKDQVQGLLGNLNGDPEDDFRFPDGTIMNPESSMKEIHKYGLHWLVIKEESIFTYLSPYDYNTYFLPDFLPTFDVPNPHDASPEIKDLCGHSLECIFDAVATGSLSFANETLLVTGIIDNIQKSSVKLVSCGFPGSVDNAIMTGSVYLVNSTVEVKCFDGFTLENGLPSLTCQSTGQWSSTLPSCTMMKDALADVGLSLLAIIFIVLGAISLCLIIIIITIFIVKQKQKNKIDVGSLDMLRVGDSK
ncbi:sushi domain-containing protein 2-like [Asterias rubens]|uniref:sushi domain-containing protein 2-like n=1 Tax=Asterias rubens TaxID=7604 RepID=UPI001454F9ED|nr:sushi domain-containing protein 2-like [Asterias rubens]